uniref:UNC93-like protein MFSD11 n=1 Tax=Acrobeloides nanus TaxID=290746 RepID=A0A914D644_9BILA
MAQGAGQVISVYINFPQNAPLDKTEDEGLIYPNIAIALTCGFFLAFADACWNTQIFSFLITYFPNQGSQAFALNLFFENLMTSAAFFYGTSFKLKYHLIILSIGAILGCISFVMAEKVQDRSVEQIDKQVSKLEF